MTVAEASSAKSRPSCRHGLRAYLKAETTSKHEALDRLYAAFRLEEKDGYAEFLSAHCVAWSAMSARWADAIGNILGIEAPDYLSLLVNDLQDIGEAGPAVLPVLASREPRSDSGLAYVLAGSRLGIGAIARQPNWGILNQRATRFIADSRGIDIFRKLAAYLDGPQGDLIDREMALQSANDCFDTFAAAAHLITDMRR